jgi:hypothetical protein
MAAETGLGECQGGQQALPGGKKEKDGDHSQTFEEPTSARRLY